MKLRLLDNFRSSKQGTVYSQFLAIKQESTVEEYRNRFHRLVTPLPQLSDEVLENTFMNGLPLWVRAEVECWASVGLVKKLKMTQLVEDQELIRSQTCFANGPETKIHFRSKPLLKSIVPFNDKDAAPPTTDSIPMRTITLRGVSATGVRHEGPSRRWTKCLILDGSATFMIEPVVSHLENVQKYAGDSNQDLL